MLPQHQEGEHVEGFPFREMVGRDEGELPVGEGGVRGHRDAAALPVDVHPGEEDRAGEAPDASAGKADFHFERAHREPGLDGQKQVNEAPEIQRVQPAFLLGGQGLLADDRVEPEAGADAEDVVFISRNGDRTEVHQAVSGAPQDHPERGLRLVPEPEPADEIVAGARRDHREADAGEIPDPVQDLVDRAVAADHDEVDLAGADRGEGVGVAARVPGFFGAEDLVIDMFGVEDGF